MRHMKRLLIALISLFICNLSYSAKEWVKVRNQDCKYFEPYYQEGLEATWSGEVIGEFANGHGKLEKFVKDKLYAVYEGQIINGHMEGQATYTVYLENGGKTVYNAPFEDGEIIGIGSMKDYFPNGQIKEYQGYLVNSYVHGYGEAKGSNGFSFEGLWYMGGMITGKGKDEHNNNFYMYQGSKVDKLPTSIISNYSPRIGEQVIEYFDKDWVRCNQNKASYYRLITYKAPNRPQGVVKDFYISGKIQSEFTPLYIDYSEDRLNFSIGDSKWYYENGQVSRECKHNNNIVVGEDINYYENGKKASLTVYDSKGVIQSLDRWSQSGKKSLTAKFKDGKLVNDRYIEYDENGVSCEVMQVNFSQNKNVWESDDDASSSVVTAANSMNFTGKVDNWIRRSNYIDVNQDKDYSFECTVGLENDKKSNKGYGLLLGFKDWSNYMLFVVSGNGYYKIINVIEGISIPIKDWSLSSMVNKGIARNHLKMMKIDDKMLFSINGTLIEKIDAARFRGGEYGMIIGGKGLFSMSNLSYKEYGSSSSTKTTAQGSKVDDNGISWDASGTGFFIDRRGYLATNYHVTKDANNIGVCIQKEGVWEIYNAIVIKSDPANDLSIIKIDDPKFVQFPSLPYNFVTDVEDIASEIYTLGYPQVHVMGSDVKYTSGTINSKTGFQGDPTHYQISAHIDHGNSGGPMFNSKGAIIGITDGGLDKAKFGDVNYAIKSSYLRSLVDALPIQLNLPHDTSIEKLNRVEQIKVLSKYTALILVDLQ